MYIHFVWENKITNRKRTPREKKTNERKRKGHNTRPAFDKIKAIRPRYYYCAVSVVYSIEMIFRFF